VKDAIVWMAMIVFSLLASWLLFFSGKLPAKLESWDVIFGVIIFAAPIFLLTSVGRYFYLSKSGENNG
jgi:hypothetical protein